MLSQFAQYAHLFNVVLEDGSVDLRASFDSAAKYNLSDAPTSFSRINIRISLRSPSPVEQVRALAAHAERGCHTHQSFQAPVPVQVEALLNNEPLDFTSRV